MPYKSLIEMATLHKSDKYVEVFNIFNPAPVSEACFILYINSELRIYVVQRRFDVIAIKCSHFNYMDYLRIGNCKY
jgi:hypothetical protein